MTTDVNDFISSCDAGVLEQKLSAAMSEVAANVLEHHKKGDVTIKLDISQIGASSQVMIKHKISYSHPTRNGKKSYEDGTETPFHVGRQGRMTLFPENQKDMFGLSKQTHQEKPNRES